MEIKKGYKQAEVGVIPMDWDVKNLLDNFTLKARIGWQGLTTEEYLSTGDYGLVTGTDFRDGYIDWDNCVYVEKIRYVQDKNIQLKVNDVLVTKDGTIGKVAFVNKLPNPTTLNSGIFVVRPKNPNIDERFFYYILMSSYFDIFLSKITAGSTITHLYQKDFSTFNFILPPRFEQNAIAQVLSDTDSYINSLEKLIEKKSQIKQGAMQELLKPKDGWETKTIKEVATYRRGSFPQPYGLDKWYDDISGFPFVQVFDVDDNNRLKDETKRYISKAAQQMSVFVKKGSIILTIQGSIGRIALTQYDAYVDRTLLIFESFKIPFNSFFFMISIWRIFEIEKELAPGGIIKTITKEALSSFKISYPKIIEQERIAQILSDIDIEVHALEEKLKKAKSIKDGMLQNLLTGKIRLI
jgi:type I restriction enzyme S subunit